MERRPVVLDDTAGRTVADLGGPRGVPLGNLPSLVRGQVMHQVLEKWCDRFGPTYRVRLGRTPAVVTADPVVVHSVLRQRPDVFRRSSVMTEVIEELGGKGVFTAEGAEWRRLRKIAAQSTSASYLRQYFTTITEVTARMRDSWVAAAGTGAPVDVLTDMRRYTLDVTTWLATGHDLNSLESTGDGLHSRLSLLFPAFARRINAPFPYWRHVKLPRDRRLDSTVRELEVLVRDRFAVARDRMADGVEPANFLEALVRPLPDEPPAGDAEVFGNVLTMLLAGEDTTSSTLAWAVHHLAEHPEAQRRVAAEAEAVLDGPVDPAAVGRLTYARAVVDEAMRLNPVTPFLIVQPNHDVTVDTGGGSLRLAEGTPVLTLLTYGSRRDRARFPDHDVFRPERWLDESPVPPELPYAPFGEGPRFCPGRNLALIEATLLLATLCRDLTISPHTATGPVRERMGFTAFPTGLAVTLDRRGQG
ncbi:cytochrome P450 [Umezawaea endophytica]|uniref:Cytochrome P450 n=1 Tax=Umezawaea endophytica TaxID=1654476 RepID=A0A9X2VJR4_9PSEU|nr:cytochrome P450 [Umezawaea endophytica]MCS7477777.1 cytochrome P450 [Umezawaea endophytica]